MQQDGYNIQIVGDNSLQNALLAAYLEHSVGISCECQARLDDVYQHQIAQAKKQVNLIDCFTTMGKVGILDMLESEGMSKVAGRLPTLLNLYPDMSVEQAALRAGIRGFFYVSDSPSTITKGVVALFNDDYWVSRKLLLDYLTTPNRIANHVVHYPGLTRRESELVNLLVQGLSNKAIADQLFVSIPTVKSHLSSVYRKITVSTRLQAVCWAEKLSH
ncbi:MAG: hypothetical protein A2075_16545 [Geobacteraceae bacterium GWC2_58_44]|nr:MAG: hypothetical protein A2075_16545 [Geobacteraceae bacterium GWC2_58_44]